MAKNPKDQRKAEQIVRQKALRIAQKDKRRPDRDDFGRLLLWLLASRQIDGCNTDAAVAKVHDDLVGHLVAQGFNEREADDMWDALLSRYGSADNPFRRKLHLQAPGDKP